MIRLGINVTDIGLVLQTYDRIKVYRGDSEGGSYNEITDVDTRLVLEEEKTVYFYLDSSGDSTKWYKTSYFKEAAGPESGLSTARQGGTEVEKIGYTFNNYAAPNGVWGKVYTADDMRYTMMFGIDSVGSDIAESEFTDEQFDQLMLEAMGEFEDYLTIDIRKRVYKTNPASALLRSRLWRNNVDYTDEEDAYDYDYMEFSNLGYLNMRHKPIISVERAVWLNLVSGQIMDFLANDWVRINKKMGQLNFYPKGGFTYGPYSVYGPLWSTLAGGRYPQGFEVDYTTGYTSSDFVPEGLRSTIAKYAAIKCLAVVGDGLMAGFSSQSISLDGLSESFSSTQSATSAFFGARIKQYSDEIGDWLKRNRYKYSPPPMSFVGI